MKHNEAVIRHAYDQAVIRLARLSLFADRGEAAGLSYSVTVRQEQLAIDDTLHLAIALRRLIEALSIRESSVGRKILVSRPSAVWQPKIQPSEINLHDTLNNIIHSQFIEVFSFSFQMEQNENIEEAYLKVIDREKWRIDPLIAVKSDRGPLTVCDFWDFCKACDEILETAEESASEMKIYLEAD